MTIEVGYDKLEQNLTHNLLSKTIDDFITSEIVTIFNSESPRIRESFSSRDITALYSKREDLIISVGKIRKEIGHDAYVKRINDITNTYPSYTDILAAEHREIITQYGYDIDPEVKNNYLTKIGKNIQKGGSNAQGVFLLSDTNLVAVVKGEGSYVHELPQRTITHNLNISSVPKVIDVFIYEGKTYKIMEKSPGIQLDHMTPEQLKKIPQEHYDTYLQDVKTIENAGLKIDPSKPSNFFYDTELGFCFIDLGMFEKGNTWSMFNAIYNFNPALYLDAEKLQIAWDRKYISRNNMFYQMR